MTLDESVTGEELIGRWNPRERSRCVHLAPKVRARDRDVVFRDESPTGAVALRVNDIPSLKRTKRPLGTRHAARRA
jgi:hypothetical protein